MIGRRTAFTMPKMAAAANRVPTFFGTESVVRWIPSITSVAIHSDTALTTSRMRIPMARDGVTIMPVGGSRSAARCADQLVFDRRLGQRRPAHRAPVDHAHHVGTNPGHPLGDVAEAQRAAEQR